MHWFNLSVFFALLLISLSFSYALIYVNDARVTIITNESFKNNFSFSLDYGNFSVKDNYIIPKGEIKIESSSLINKLDNGYRLYQPFALAEVYLPKNIILDISDNILNVRSYDGNIVIDSKSGFIFYKQSNKQSFDSYVIILLILALVLIFLALILTKRNKRIKQPEVKHETNEIASLSNLLDQKELEVLKAIKKYPGINQKKLGALLGIKKSSLSLLIKRLESKGLIKKVRYGMSTLLYIKELEKKL